MKENAKKGTPRIEAVTAADGHYVECREGALGFVREYDPRNKQVMASMGHIDADTKNRIVREFLASHRGPAR